MQQRFYGNMDWFEVAEQPDDFKALPPEFAPATPLVPIVPMLAMRVGDVASRETEIWKQAPLPPTPMVPVPPPPPATLSVTTHATFAPPGHP